MTRKDYIKIADTLIDSYKHCYGLELTDMVAMHKVYVKQFCTTLLCDNVKFNKDKFLEYIDKRMGGWII